MDNSTNPALVFNLQESQLLEMLSSELPRLYAILDACDAPQVLEKLNTLPTPQWTSLFIGEARFQQEAIAPYLVKIDAHLFEWIRSELWNEPWGIFVVSDSPLAEVQRHFRRFLIVEDPDGNPMYFRFYDPRVAPLFPEAGLVSAPVDSIHCGWAGASLQILRHSNHPDIKR